MDEPYDLVVRGGTVVTSAERTVADVAMSGGRVVALGRALGTARREIDASGLLVLPGGVDSHCHVEQLSAAGLMCADDFESATVSAAFGGTTTLVSFAAQHRGMSVTEVVRDYHECAEPKAVVDYAFHIIVSDPTPKVLHEELPPLIQEGYRSLKVFMTYDRLRLDDYQILQVLALARREGALTMVHAENHDMIRWLGEGLLAAGHRAARFHAVAHAALAEREAVSRMLTLAELVDAPVFIVHVSTPEALEAIKSARERGQRVHAETCPQYLFLTADDLNREGVEGAKYFCSPPPRDEAAQEALWEALRDGTLGCFTSDHAPYRLDTTGKLARGPNPSFREIASGVPGLEVRTALLFSEGVGQGRIDLHRFVELTSTEPARIFGLFPRKGTIAVGSDGDLALWDPEREVELGSSGLHDRVGYTPYQGRRVRGWPVTVVRRGEVVIEEGQLRAESGSGRYLPRETLDAAVPAGRASKASLLARRFGARSPLHQLS